MSNINDKLKTVAQSLKQQKPLNTDCINKVISTK